MRWRVVRTMVVAWVLTLPAAGLMGAGALAAVEAFSNDTAGAIVVGWVALALAGVLLWLARRNDVAARNIIEPLPASGVPIAASPATA